MDLLTLLSALGPYPLCIAVTALLGWFLWRSWQNADE